MNRTNQRVQKFHALASDAWYGPIYKRLRPKEAQCLLDFLKNHGELEAGPFVIKLQNTKFFCKNENLIHEILLICR